MGDHLALRPPREEDLTIIEKLTQDPGARGHGDGTQAHRLLARYLFAHSTAHRIEASTETANLAERRALEKAGFTAEGVARAIGWRDGQWRDGVTYSLLRTDPAAHPAPAPDAAP
jgi:RimJ/RimL family protein N-acetyltransferase